VEATRNQTAEREKATKPLRVKPDTLQKSVLLVLSCPFGVGETHLSRPESLCRMDTGESVAFASHTTSLFRRSMRAEPHG
jgi:hypothetical protein